MQILTLQDIFNTPQAPVAVTWKLPQHAYPEHAHDVDEIVIVTSGHGTHVLNGRSFTVRRGDIFYVRAGDWHLFEDVSNLHLFNILCCGTQRPRQTVLPQHGCLIDPPAHWQLRREVLDCVERVAPRLDAECRTIDDATPCMINVFFAQVLAYLWRGRVREETSGKRTEAWDRQVILELLGYLDECFADDISLDGLARRYAMSERSLNRQFKEHTGLPPMNYLLQLRLSKAIHYLRKGNSAVTDVAFRCGFNDSTYFSHCFKKRFGLAPAQFQHKHLTRAAPLIKSALL